MAETLKRTPLFDLHLSLGAKMTAFAGYEMPVQYPMGVLKEHLHTRSRAGLFDISHMGQCFLTTSSVSTGTLEAHQAVAAALEKRVPGEVRKLKAGRLRYSLLLNDDGGIVDDLMITRPPAEDDRGRLFLVVNAGCKEKDYALISAALGDETTLEIADDRALLALQGPEAARVIDDFFPGAAAQPFMSMMSADYDGAEVFVSRCGYTGEDGYELSVPVGHAKALAESLLCDEAVEPIGLGARDSLRLEAGLCLYGHDLSEDISPVEASLEFALGKRRRAEGGFAGAARIQRELAEGPARRRVGIQPEGRAPAREGVSILNDAGEEIGKVTSGGYGPSAERPIAMGYVDAAYAEDGAKIGLSVRGKTIAAQVAPTPFVPHQYYRG